MYERERKAYTNYLSNKWFAITILPFVLLSTKPLLVLNPEFWDKGKGILLLEFQNPKTRFKTMLPAVYCVYKYIFCVYY